jgi:hypothetical protein
VGFPYGTLSGTVAESLEKTPRESVMSKVFSALAVSVDGYITGRDPGPDRGLGDGGKLFDWYFDGDVPSRVVETVPAPGVTHRHYEVIR